MYHRPWDRNRLSTIKRLILICLAPLAIVAQAAGVRDFAICADASGPEISAQFWTPCAEPAGSILVNRGSFQWAIRGVKDCPPSGKNLPLIVISHGMLEDMFSHHDTAAFLADAGFAVVTLNHTQDSVTSSKDTIDNISAFLVRPVDVKRAISFVLNKPPAAVTIDSRRIGFFGFSRGGYTGLVLAGAVPDFHTLLFPCPESIRMCRQIRDNQIPAQISGYEPRITAFVIADPLSFFPNQASLKQVTAPIQLWSSENGGMGVRPEDVMSVERNLPITPEFHRPAHSAHFAFQFPCSKEVAQAMSLECTDPPGFDRVDFHRKFNAQLLKFFRKSLTGHNDS